METSIQLRPAVLEDAGMIFRWRNDPFIVARSSFQREVRWDEHLKWFEETIHGERRKMFIIEREGRPLGQVRFDRLAEGVLAISVYLLEESTGKGYGIEAVRSGCARIFGLPDVQRIIACVRRDNHRARSAFIKAGFLEEGDAGLCPDAHFTLSLSRTKVWKEDDRRIASFYADLIARYGVDARALDWGSRESQRLRFAVLAQVGSLAGARVLDVGCGMGDFLGWLTEAGIEVDYTGIDITPGMIDIAKRRFPAGRFEIRNLLEDGPAEVYDYVFASGVFYYRQTEPVEFMRKMIEALFSVAGEAVVFNSLSAWSPGRDPGEFYADPLETIQFCRSLTSRMALRHDYHPRDFTLYLYKKEYRKEYGP